MSAWCPCNTYTCKYKCIFNILMNNYGNVLKMTQSLYNTCTTFIIITQLTVYIEFVLTATLHFTMINHWLVVSSCAIYMFTRPLSIWLWYERLKLKSSMSLWLTCSLNTIELSTCNGVLKHQYLEFPKQLEVLVSSIHL